jgi:TonB family protein
MAQLKLIFITLLTMLLIGLMQTPRVNAQATASETKTFNQDGVEFDYPAGWRIINGSDQEARYVELATVTKDVQLMVYWHFAPALECEFEGTRKRISRALAERVGTQFRAVNSSTTQWTKTSFGDLPAEQAQLHGAMSGTPVTADIYSFFIHEYFLNLIFLRTENDPAGKSAWETIRTTLKVTPPIGQARGKPVGGVVLNGRALRLPRPNYPGEARSARASGAVVVQVRIDESGDVVAVCAISGHKLLRPAAEDAASHAKFSPTILNGTPVRIIGIITFNFVAR